MNEIIKINNSVIGQEEVETVNARELHEFLEVETRFNDWIERRIKEYGFIINSDFCSILSKSSGGRPATEYHISIDMAKELSMVEKNEKGKEARKYFIQCERIAKTGKKKQPKAKPSTLSQQHKEAAVIMQAHLKVGKLLGTDLPMARAVSVERTRKLTGIDYRPMLIGNTVQEVPVGIRELSNQLNIKEAVLKDKLTQIGLIQRDKENRIMLSDKAKELQVGSIEPFQSPNSEYTGYQSKWYPSKIKDILANHYIN